MRTAYTSIRVTKQTHELVCRLARLEDRPVGLTVARLIRDAAEQAGIVRPRKTTIDGKRESGNSN